MLDSFKHAGAEAIILANVVKLVRTA